MHRGSRGRGDALFQNLNRDDGAWQSAQLTRKPKPPQPKAQPKAPKVQPKAQEGTRRRSAEEILAGFRSGWKQKLEETEQALGSSKPRERSEKRSPSPREIQAPEGTVTFHLQ
ncbi:unnamed protein product [Effrenium voratum]|nr:unnamed protein product [Effrenium voratum]